jgi:WD40 repeat protein
VVFSPANQWLATASSDQTVRLSDVNTGGALSLRLDAPIGGLAWSRDAIAIGNGASIVLLDVVTQQLPWATGRLRGRPNGS